MRPGHVMLALLILVGGYAVSHAEPEAPAPLTPLVRTEIRQEPMRPFVLKTPAPSVERTILGELTRNHAWLPGVLLFLAALLKRDRGAWWFAFLAGVATLVIFGAATFTREVGPWLEEPVGMLIGTVVVLAVTFGLFVLHQKRLDIFARTEITFGVIGIGYSISTIQQPGIWAALLVSIYGLVEGFTRMREADGPDSLLAAFDGPTREAL